VRNEQIEQVNDVLREIGADHIPQILVWNKIDAAGLEPGVERDEYDKISRVFISAQSGAGLDLLRAAIVEAATAAPGLARFQEERDDAGFAPPDAPGPDSMPTSTQVGPH
jgi:GTP-binding protein HflX